MLTKILPKSKIEVFLLKAGLVEPPFDHLLVVFVCVEFLVEMFSRLVCFDYLRIFTTQVGK